MVLCRSVTALAAFFLLGSTLAVPLADKLKRLGPETRDVLKRSTPAAPYFVVYDDGSPSPASADQLQGYNVYALSFWRTSGPADMAMNWQELTNDQRTSYLQEYNAAGISIIVSAFGDSDAPTSTGTDPVAIANNLASWTIQYGLQGVDIDYEDLAAFYGGTGSAESWLTSLTQQLRTQLPQGQYILSHAPIAALFAPNAWGGGGYLQVDRNIGSLIDWYNIQFYNQGGDYASCASLLASSYSQTALFQISANGVPLNKLVIGKLADPGSGYMPPEVLASCVSQAHADGWGAGLMVWAFPDASSAWINTARGGTFQKDMPGSKILEE